MLSRLIGKRVAISPLVNVAPSPAQNRQQIPKSRWREVEGNPRVEMVDDVVLHAHRHQITKLTFEATRLPISILLDPRVVGHPAQIELEVGGTNVER